MEFFNERLIMEPDTYIYLKFRLARITKNLKTPKAISCFLTMHGEDKFRLTWKSIGTKLKKFQSGNQAEKIPEIIALFCSEFRGGFRDIG